MSDEKQNAPRTRKKWYVIAREEGRVCRICGESISIANWRNKTYDHLCIECWARESSIRERLGNSSAFRLGRE